MRVSVVILILGICSCKSYKQNLLYQSDADFAFQSLSEEANKVKENFKIQVDDLLNIEIYSHKGERLIDPDNELFEGNVQLQSKPRPKYLVQKNGVVQLPMIGDFNLEGLTLRESNLKLAAEYSKYYTDPFVITNFTNKRIIVMGAPGGKVIPLENENTTLAEAITLAGGIGTNGKASNIKLFRTNRVYQFDLSVLNNWEQSNFAIESGDIIYIEPIRRPLVESIRDITPVMGLVTSLIALVILIVSL